MQFRRIVQAEEAALHAAAGGKFREHGSEVTAGTLHPTGCVQFWEEANDHGQSLPSAANNGKSRSIMVLAKRDSNLGFQVGWSPA